MRGGPEFALRTVEPLAEPAVLAGCERGGLEVIARAVELLAEPARPGAGGAAPEVAAPLAELAVPAGRPATA